MAIPSQANVYLTTDTFFDWITKTNQIATALANVVVTANSSLGVTTGNAYVNGYFTANSVYVKESISGGDNGSPDVLNIATGFSTNTTFFISGTTTLASNSAGQVVDTFTTGSYATIKYLVQVKTATNYQATELMLLQDGTNTYLTEYATLANNGSVGVFSADISSGNCRLLFSPTSSIANYTIYYNRTSLSA